MDFSLVLVNKANYVCLIKVISRSFDVTRSLTIVVFFLNRTNPVYTDNVMITLYVFCIDMGDLGKYGLGAYGYI